MKARLMLAFAALAAGGSLLAGTAAAEQQHFQPVTNTGLHSAIVVNNALIDGIPLEEGDEIAVFDGDLCVGAVVFQGSFPVSCPGTLEFVPPIGDRLPGAKNGNPIQYKIWQESTEKELNATATTITGGRFGDVLTVVYLLESTGTDVEDDPKSGMPADFGLDQNYPNPFNPETTIRYRIPVDQEVQLLVFDHLGRLVRTLFHGPSSAGIHSIVWDGRNDRGRLVNSGLYLIRIRVGEKSQTRKVLLSK